MSDIEVAEESSRRSSVFLGHCHIILLWYPSWLVSFVFLAFSSSHFHFDFKFSIPSHSSNHFSLMDATSQPLKYQVTIFSLTPYCQNLSLFYKLNLVLFHRHGS